jgi:iron complex transport system substrate-binding protein
MMNGAATTLLRCLARFAGAALVAALVFVPGAARAEKPRRIASINLCTDQIAMLLVPRERIVSLSFLAADPASSAMAKEARGFHLNRGRAEEILPLSPDIVLAGPYAARAAVGLLRRLGHPVFELPIGESLADVPRHIRAVARILGEETRGESVIADFEARLRAVPAPPPGSRPVAALYAPNGITSGSSSLPQSVMTAAGFENLAARHGIIGVGRLGIEDIVAARPDALILARLSVEHPSLAARSLEHPALATAVPEGAIIAVPHHIWACAIPQIVTGVEALAKLRMRLSADGERR